MKSIGGKAESGKRKRAGEMSDEYISLPFLALHTRRTNILILEREASDDAETNTFNSDANGTEASDDEAPTAKKTKTNNNAANGKGTNKNKNKTKALVKVENEEEAENKTIHDKGYENAFGGDGVDDFA